MADTRKIHAHKTGDHETGLCGAKRNLTPYWGWFEGHRKWTAGWWPKRAALCETCRRIIRNPKRKPKEAGR